MSAKPELRRAVNFAKSARTVAMRHLDPYYHPWLFWCLEAAIRELQDLAGSDFKPPPPSPP